MGPGVAGVQEGDGLYGDEESLLDARRRYFEVNAFGADGGYAARWVKIQAGPLVLAFPNSDARRRAVRYHDLHHVLTDYDTDWIGEAEIGAWEVASSCADHWAAWYLNLVVMGVGAIIAPRRTWRAFVRGRRSKNLYREPWEAIRLEERVGAWRERLGLDAAVPEATRADALAFAAWLVPAFLCWALNSLLVLAPLALVVWGVAKLV